MDLRIYQPPAEEPNHGSNLLTEISESVRLPELREAVSDLAHLISVFTAQRLLDVARESESLKDGISQLGDVLKHLPEQINEYVGMLGNQADGVQLEARHVQLIREHVVAGLLPYLNSPDSEMQAIAFHAITSTTLKIPELIPLALHNLEIQRPEEISADIPINLSLHSASLCFLASQDLSGLDSLRLEVVAAYLAPDKNPLVRAEAAKVLGQTGITAVKYVPDLIAMQAEFLERDKHPAAAGVYGKLAREVWRQILNILPDVANPEDFLLTGESNPLRRLGVELSGDQQKWISELVRANPRKD